MGNILIWTGKFAGRKAFYTENTVGEHAENHVLARAENLIAIVFSTKSNCLGEYSGPVFII